MDRSIYLLFNFLKEDLAIRRYDSCGGEVERLVVVFIG